MIDLGLNAKGALVSGAGYIPERAGHGRACALKLAEAGAAVACIDIDQGRAEGTAAEVMAARITGQTLVVDGGATIRELWGISEDALPRFQSGNYEVRPG
jgi:3-oxoacyl-[acyl-carrier protein] reductase